MTFTTALLSSFTLTTSVLYLTVLHHRRTRLRQASLLNEQTLLLNSLASPQLASDLAAARNENFSGFAGREKIWPFSLYYTRNGGKEPLTLKEVRLKAVGEKTDDGAGVEEEEVLVRIGPEEFAALSRPWQERWKDGWNREIGAGYKWVFGGGLKGTWEDIRGDMMRRLERQRDEAAAAAEKGRS